MEEADQLCDRVAIIDHGRILALDTPAELKRVDRRRHDRHGHRRRATSTRSADVLADERRRRPPTPRVVDGAVRCRPCRRATGVLPAVVTAAERAGFAVTDLSVTEPTLETVFINLTGKDLRE